MIDSETRLAVMAAYYAARERQNYSTAQYYAAHGIRTNPHAWIFPRPTDLSTVRFFWMTPPETKILVQQLRRVYDMALLAKDS